MIGVVTGRQIFTNRDGVQLRTMLQVELGLGDVKTAELIGTTGDDTNPPDGARVFVAEVADSYLIAIAMTDDIMPEVDPGERELYSIDGTGFLKMGRVKLWANGDVTITSTNGLIEQAKITAGVDGTILLESLLGGGTVEIDALGNVINNAGLRSATAFQDLKIAFDQLKSDFDLHTHPYVDTPVGPSVTSPPSAPSTAVIDPAESPTVLIP